jgi:hypothetical protein
MLWVHNPTRPGDFLSAIAYTATAGSPDGNRETAPHSQRPQATKWVRGSFERSPPLPVGRFPFRSLSFGAAGKSGGERKIKAFSINSLQGF